MQMITVLQHTSADYLGLMEDHLEGRNIGFRYVRPFTEGVGVPRFESLGNALMLMGGGPWGAAGVRDVPTLDEEVALVRTCLFMDLPVLAFGLGSQILALAAQGGVEASPLTFTAGHATRTDSGALNGYLPERFPCIRYGRDRAVPPPYARTLATDELGHPALWQIGERVLGFSFHPGFKRAIAEDLIMEFEESPADPGPELARAAAMKPEIEDSLVAIMTGIVQVTGLMSPGSG